MSRARGEWCLKKRLNNRSYANSDGNEGYRNNPSLPRLRKYAMNNLLKALKLEHEWLKKSDSKVFQEVCANLDKAWQLILAGVTEAPLLVCTPK